MVVIQVDGKDYELTEEHVKLMKYVEEAQAIEEGGVPFNISRLKSPKLIKKHLKQSSPF